MPAAETFIALSALGPALFKTSIPATAALSASGAAAVPTTAPTAGLAAVSAAGGGVGLKSLGTALLLAKKGGATAVAKAGSSILSVTKGAGANAASGGSAVSFPASAATTASPALPTSGPFSSPSHVGASTPLHHASPFHSHATAPGSGVRSVPSPNAPPPDTSAGRLSTPHAHHKPVAVAGGDAGSTGSAQSVSDHHRHWHHSGARGAGETSRNHQHLHATKPQARATGRPSVGGSKPTLNKGGNSSSRRAGGTTATSVPATGSAATGPAEQTGAQQSAGDSAGGGSHEFTVISTLIGVALLRWAVSSLCFSRNTQQTEEPETEAVAAKRLGFPQKSRFEGTELGGTSERGNKKKQQCSGRRVERWKRAEELLLGEEDDFDHITLLSKLSEKIEELPSNEPAERRRPILEVCLSDNEGGDEYVVAQGEAVETSQEDKKEWPFPDPRHAADQILTGVSEWEVKEGNSEEIAKSAEDSTGGLRAVQQPPASHDGLENTSDTTIASSRYISEFRSASQEMAKKQRPSALHEAFSRQRSSGRMAAFL